MSKRKEQKTMRTKRALAAFAAVLVFLAVFLAGCGEPPKPEEVGTPGNLQVQTNDDNVVLTWERTEEAVGYRVMLLNAYTNEYDEVEDIGDETTYTYPIPFNTTAEYHFGVNAYLEFNGQKIYGDDIVKATVITEKEAMTLLPETISTQVGSRVTITAEVTPTLNPEIKWESDNPMVAMLAEDGEVVTVSKGVAHIKATTAIGTEATCTINVVDKTEVPTGKLVALTFDDGPHSQYTDKLLDALKKYKAKATFFMLGQNVVNNEDVVRRIKEEGHELGNHTWSHENLTKLDGDEIDEQIEKTNNAVYEACGEYPTVIRAPYGALDDDVLEHFTAPSVYWSEDTLDWQAGSAKEVKEAIMDNAYDGAIILVHDIHKNSVNGAIMAIPELQKKGYTLVTVTELLSRNGDVPQAGKTYYDMEPAG